MPEPTDRDVSADGMPDDGVFDGDAADVAARVDGDARGTMVTDAGPTSAELARLVVKAGPLALDSQSLAARLDVQAVRGVDPDLRSAIRDQALDVIARADAAPKGPRVPRASRKVSAACDAGSFERGDHVELGRALLRDVRGAGQDPVADEGTLHEYDPTGGLWRPVPLERQSLVVQGYAGRSYIDARGKPQPLKVRSNDVAGAIKLAADRAHRPRFFDDAPRGLAFTNGFVSVTAAGVTLRPHAPENRARYGYPFAYEAAEPAAFVAFLQAIFRDDRDQGERIAFMQEFFGACLLGIATQFQKCVATISPGESGRTTLGKIIIEAMPAGSVASIAPQLFASEYRRAKLVGKLLNFVAELPESEILDSESFKAIVTGDLIDARPIYCPPIDFRPVAGHFYAANRLPGTADLTHAFFRRFVVLRFSRQFLEGDPDRDTDIARRIIKVELPAIVSFLIDGAARVMRHEAYTIPPSSEAAKDEWRLGADQLAQFVAERLVRSTDARPSLVAIHDWTTGAQLYESYRIWADAAGHRPPLARNKFGGRLTLLGHAKIEMNTGTFYALRIRQPGESRAGVGAN